MIYCSSLHSIQLDQPIIQEVIYLILELELQLQLFKIKLFMLKNMYQMYSSLLMRILRIKRFQLAPHTSKVGAQPGFSDSASNLLKQNLTLILTEVVGQLMSDTTLCYQKMTLPLWSKKKSINRSKKRPFRSHNNRILRCPQFSKRQMSYVLLEEMMQLWSFPLFSATTIRMELMTPISIKETNP